MDGLRLLCALAVAGHHYGATWDLDGVHPVTDQLPVASHLLVFGFLGVEIFFMISGFVICMSTWGRGVGDYFVSRVSRIYPAFWVCVLLTSIVVTLLPVTPSGPTPVAEISRQDIAANLTMLAEPLGTRLIDPAYWTLWVELRFYLLFALLCWRGLTYRRAVTFCVLWMVAAVLAPSANSDLLTTLVMPKWAPYFVAGIAMYLLHRYRPNAMIVAIIGFCWLVSVHHAYARPIEISLNYPLPLWPAPVIVTLGYAVMIAIALGWTDRINWRWLSVAGALTYPFYLLHMRIGYSLIRTAHEHTGLPAWPLILGAVAIVLALAWLVHRFVERPAMPVLRSRLRRALDDIHTTSALDEQPGVHPVATADGTHPVRPALHRFWKVETEAPNDPDRTAERNRAY
jgi:peptidoglycan/LPS O-acetylase OafA/YrhL